MLRGERDGEPFLGGFGQPPIICYRKEVEAFVSDLEAYTRAAIHGTRMPEAQHAYQYQRILVMCRAFHEHGVLPVHGGYADQNPLLLMAFDRIEDIKRELAPRD